MPVPTRLMSPPLATPSWSDMRTVSNNTGYTPTVVSGGGQQKLNVVTRVAIEGKVKRGQKGASIRMYLKISIPLDLDLVTPGSFIPLFPEENIRVLKSQVHPLDHNSAPYNFSSSLSPMLHSAARALNLPARTSQTFDSALKQARSNHTHPLPIRSSKSEHNDLVAPVGVHYTGSIQISEYNVAFVLPKEFLPRSEPDESYMRTPSKDMSSRSRSDDEAATRTPLLKGRASISDRNQAQFMAAIDLWVPLLSTPPRSPFLLAIPTSRCLHNLIRLRIFPPHTTSTSFASLSSMEEDSNTWDLTSDPHVTRSASRPSRMGSYSHFADDESSDNSASAAYESCVIQGTFPSTQQIRVRWARPPRRVNIPGEEDALRRVGVENVKGEMICTVRNRASHPTRPELEGILMDVEYSGECKGIWFPGVATMLGLDVNLVSRNCDVFWAPGHSAPWDVTGGSGFTGFDHRLSTQQAYATHTSPIELNGMLSEHADPSVNEISRTHTKSGTLNGSLLQAPLPSQTVEDYSFEGSNATLPSGASSVSLPVSSESNKLPEPCSTVVIHLNLNDLQPLVENRFKFSISGTIVITPRPRPPRTNDSANSIVDGPELVTLPRFTVLAADNESVSSIVRNEVEDASVEVFNAHGDIHKDPQSRKTVLQRNGTTRCGDEGGRIALKFLDPLHLNGNLRSLNRPRTPSNNMAYRSSRNAFSTRAKREGPPIITSAEAVVTALTPGEGRFPDGYAVRLSLKTPVIFDSEWLEFGISLNKKVPSSSVKRSRPKVVLICASIDGVPVKAEVTKAAPKVAENGASFDIMNDQEWMFWGKVYAAGSAGGNMVVDYLVREEKTPVSKEKKKMPDFTTMDILLPTFFISVARFEVKIDAMPGLDISSVHSEFDYVRAVPEGHRLLLCSLKEHTHPQLSLTIRKSPGGLFNTLTNWYFVIIWACLFAIFVSLTRLSTETDRLRKITDGYSAVLDAWPDIPTITVSNGTGILRFDSSSSTVIHPEFVTPDFISSRSTTETTTTTTTPKYDFETSDVNVKESTIAVTPPSLSALGGYGLMPMANFFAFTWTDQHTAAVKHALEKVTLSVRFVYDVCKKLYHYPLDPP